MKKRILLLTQWFDPEPNIKGLVFARELVNLGYEVEVVTGFPNYPGGKIYPGYRMSWRHCETIEGVQITRLPLYPSHDDSAVRRVANYLSFAVSAAIYCLFQARKADALYAFQLPTVAVVAALVKVFRGTPVLYDVQDIWPDTLRATGMVSSDKVLTAVSSVANWVYSRMDMIVVQSPGFRRLLVGRGVAAEKIQVIYNWCDEQTLNEENREGLAECSAGDKFRILFAGNMGKAQSLGAVLDAAEHLKAQFSRVSFVFIGGGVEVDRLKASARQRALDNVTFIPRVPMDRIGEHLRRADALLVHLKADPLFSITIPAKTQAYMAIGKPILMAVLGDAAALVRAARCGVTAAPENATAIADAATEMATLPKEDLVAMGQRARHYYNSNLAISVGVKKFAEIFERLITVKSLRHQPSVSDTRSPPWRGDWRR